ncbi:MAG: hypothetical protein JNM89_09240 [Hyphomicrobiaceae bacterium]|nr:hypothetical protein [Hyphomicrobiaceae bacterium]
MVGMVGSSGAVGTSAVGGSRARRAPPRIAPAPTPRGAGAAKALGARVTCPAPETPAQRAARGFLAWLREHDLCREWTVDDVWYLAEADFAEALGLELPPRRVFLGELQKLDGVRVTYDRRIYDRAGRMVRKTTFYKFAAGLEAAEHAELKLAA